MLLEKGKNLTNVDDGGDGGATVVVAAIAAAMAARVVDRSEIDLAAHI
jgi:hypothetical protein